MKGRAIGLALIVILPSEHIQPHTCREHRGAIAFVGLRRVIHGKMPVLHQVSLNNFPLKLTGKVSSVSSQSQQMMEMLNHYGINIGSQIKVLKVFDFDGSLQIKISKQPACVISGQAAQNIFVYDDQ